MSDPVQGTVVGPPLSWLAFTPRDTVFIRDGRSFDAGAQFQASTVRPWPSTIAGALGAALGGEAGGVLGPVLAQHGPDGWEPWFPVPADLATETGDGRYAVRLRPETVDGVTDLEDTAGRVGGVTRWLAPPPGLVTGKVEPLPGWLAGQQLGAYLAGELPGDGGVPVADLGLADPLYPEFRVGFAREVGRRVARTGFLYQAAHLRLADGWAFLAGYRPNPEWDDGPRPVASLVQLGGRGRLADVVPAEGFSWPAVPDRFEGGRVLVYVATPAIWPGGWRIPVPSGARLVAAATGDPDAVATTSPRLGWRTNRALRWAVPAGSVYLLQFDGEDEAVRWAHGVHGTAYGRDDDDRLRTAGFGVVLTGVWT